MTEKDITFGLMFILCIFYLLWIWWDNRGHE